MRAGIQPAPTWRTWTFPSCATADGALTFVEYFSIDKETGLEKGLILVRLR
jgi:hypothetical protein